MHPRFGRAKIAAPHETPTPTRIRKMDDQTNRAAPRHVIEALDASSRDVAEGRVHDAQIVHAEARRMLADYQAARSVALVSRRRGPTRRTRSIL